MVAFATAVVLQLFAEVNGLLPGEVGGAGHAGNTVRSMTQGAGSIGFGAAVGHLVGKTIEGTKRKYKYKFFHFSIVKKRGLVRDPARQLLTTGTRPVNQTRLLTGVADAVNRTGVVVRHQDGAVRQIGHVNRASQRTVGRLVQETISKHFCRSCIAIGLDRNEVEQVTAGSAAVP